MEHARERWAALTNGKLEQRGRDERVDHRSYERQGIDREPGHHYGPAAAYMAARGVEHDRLDEAVANARLDDAERALDHHIHELESSDHGGGRGGMTHDDEEERKQRQEHKRNDPSPLDDRFLGR
jgi:hypothetical protein